MQYFGGFGLSGDYALFAKLLQDFGYKQNLYDIVGFSSGALLALQCAMQRIKQKQRIGKLILISPLLYTHHITQDSMLNMQDMQEAHTNQLNGDSNSKIDLLFKNMSCITHASFESVAREFRDIPSLWNLFMQACIYSYKKDRLSYHNELYRQLGLNILPSNKQANENQCIVFTHFENIDILRNMWRIGLIDFHKIKQKAQIFVIIMAEHDRILNSNLISKYLSQFGICYILKGCNHILQKENNL